jgi:hypothetical protein
LNIISAIVISSAILFLAIFYMPPMPDVYAQQPNNGTESSALNLSNSPGNSTDPKIGVFEKNIYVVWSDATTGNGDIYFKRSGDNGTTFGAIDNLSNSPGNSTDPKITVFENNIYVVWSDATTGNGDIYFKRSGDNGTTFSETQNLSRNNTGSSSDPHVSVIDKNVYVVWTDGTSGQNEIYLRNSNDTGDTFRGVRELSKTRSVDGEDALFPQMSAVGKNIYVVWQDMVSGNNEIFLRDSDDAGNKFKGIKNLSKNNTGDSISPHIVASGTNVFVAWTDFEPSQSEIFLRASTDSADTFGGIKNVSWSNGASYDPEMAVGGNSSLYVLWEDTSFTEFTFDLILRASRDMANTFEEKVNLGRYIGEMADYGNIAAYGNSVFVTWSDAPQYRYPPVYEIFLQASGDNGKSFGDAINLSTGPGNSVNPQIAVSQSSNSVFIIWSEIIEGKSDIHFIKLQNFV